MGSSFSRYHIHIKTSYKSDKNINDVDFLFYVEKAKYIELTKENEFNISILKVRKKTKNIN